MSVPDLQYVVEAVRARYPEYFDDEAMLCRYCHECVTELYTVDDRFGHLLKAAGQTHCKDAEGNRHARDVSLFQPSGQVVDFIKSAGWGYPEDMPPGQTASKNEVTWGLGPEGEYGPQDWLAPIADGGGPPPVDPPIDPPPTDPPDDLALALKVKQLEQRIEAVNTAHNTRLGWLEQGVSGPDYEGVGRGQVRILGYNAPVTVTVVSKPVRTDAASIPQTPSIPAPKTDTGRKSA